MRAVDLILKKKSGEAMTQPEITWLVDGFVKGAVPDYQMAAWMMAVCFQGMNQAETAALTDAMIRSGDTVDLSALPGVKVDKHSTGGVGDTTTLVIAPLVAACGGTVAKMSGRGLGHTGGTLDKLESIPGVNIEIPIRRFFEIVHKTGLCVMGQTENLVPGRQAHVCASGCDGHCEQHPAYRFKRHEQENRGGRGCDCAGCEGGHGGIHADD